MELRDSFSHDQISEISWARGRVEKGFLACQNVVACGVGYKVKGGEQTGQLSVVASVTHKVPSETLPQDDVIPQAIDGILTDVVETGTIVSYGLNRYDALRPVRPGVSIGHRDGTAGTVGCIVCRGAQYFILGNNHVLALINRAEQGDPILQPGPGDGGTLLDVIGELDTFVPLRFMDEVPAIEEDVLTSKDAPGCLALLLGLADLLVVGMENFRRPAMAEPAPRGDWERQNRHDAALVRPLNNDFVDPSIVDLGGAPAGVAVPVLGMRVMKSGRTTGLTGGIVTQVSVTVDVRYGDRTARFVDQVMTTPFSRAGDSGALVLDYERRAVGLLFSGSDLITVVSPIQSVLEALDVKLVTETG